MQDKIEKRIEDYIRVTDIVGQFSDYSKIPADVLERKKNIGTDVHLAIEAETGDFFHKPMEESRGYIDSYFKWKENIEGQVLLSEARIFNDELNVTGCLDCVMKINEQLFLVDFKTSSQPNEETWPLQGHFYMYLYEKEYGVKIERAVFLQLDKFGKKPKLYEYEWNDGLWKVCLAYLEVYKYRK